MGLHKFVASIWDFGVCVLRVCSGLDDDHGDADDDHDEGIVPLHYLVYYVYMLPEVIQRYGGITGCTCACFSIHCSLVCFMLSSIPSVTCSVAPSS